MDGLETKETGGRIGKLRGDGAGGERTGPEGRTERKETDGKDWIPMEGAGNGLKTDRVLSRTD